MADSKSLFVLLETSPGYSLFEVVAFEEIGNPLTEDTVTDLKRFGRAVKLKAFFPFETAQQALENANAISEHAMTETLHDFLELNLPKKSKKYTLGVIDAGLATAISEGLGGISCRSDETVREIVRGCRLHFDTMVKGMEGGALQTKAQLGLGHSYSRSKVKFNPARSDNMIIQSIALLDQMDKDLNTFAMRIREWYSWHFPELKSIVKDNIIFARAAAYIQDKGSLVKNDDKLQGLAEIVGDEDTAKQVQAAAKTSMGMDCSAVDMVNIINFTQRMVKLAEFRKKLSLYLTEKMNVVAPNLSALIGDTVGARLISKVSPEMMSSVEKLEFVFAHFESTNGQSNFCTRFISVSQCRSFLFLLPFLYLCIFVQAGSLTNLAKAPASTVQILGAEKALFRALKTKGNTPKYGLIYHSTFIGRADAKNKGRISRYLANKCSIATRIDSFSDEPSRLYGEKLREQVEERLKFYETGAAPRRNIDVMKEVAKQLKVDDDDDVDMENAEPPSSSKKDKKSKKKDKKKRKVDEDDDDDDEAAEEQPSKKAKPSADEEPAADKKKSKKDKKEKKKRKSKES
jgi:nucleolar protein 56